MLLIPVKRLGEFALEHKELFECKFVFKFLIHFPMEKNKEAKALLQKTSQIIYFIVIIIINKAIYFL